MTVVAVILTAAAAVAWLTVRIRRHIDAIDAITHRRGDARFARRNRIEELHR